MATQLEVNIKAAIDTAQSAKNVQQLRKSIKELNSLGLQLGSDQREAFKKIATAVGEAQDRVEDLRDDFVAFKGSAVEKLTGSFNLLQEGIANLDFDKVSSQLKNLGTVISANPLLFLAKIVIELVSSFDELVASGGLIGDTLKLVGDIVNEVITGFKKLTDEIGLTNNVLKEQAKIQKDIADRIAIDTQRRFDAEIAYAKEAGKSTTELEIQKQQAIIETNRIALKALAVRFITNKKLTDDERKQVTELRRSSEDAFKEINLIKLKSDKEQKKSSENKNKELEKELTIYEKLIKQQRELDEAITNAIANGDIEEAQNLGNSYKGISSAINKINKEAETAKKNLTSLTEVIKLQEEELQDTALTEKEYINGLGWLSPAEAKAVRDKIKAEEELAELQRQSALTVANDIAKAGQQLLNEETNRELEANKIILNSIEEVTNKQISSLEKRKEAGLLTESQLAMGRSEILQKEQKDKIALEKKQIEIQNKAFKRNKAFQLGLIAIDLAKQISAINANSSANPTNALTFGVAGLTQAGTLTALAITQSAIQAGLVLAQKPPAFARGGIVTGTGTGTSDSITARLSNGESVINANSTQAFAPLLSAINELGGGRSFLPDSNTATAGGTSGNTQPIIKTYVVESEITNSQKNANKTKRLTSI